MSEVNGLEQQGQALAVQVNAVQVVDQRGFEAAAEFLRGIKGYLKRVDDVFKPIVESAHRAHKVALEQKKALEAPALGAERILKERMGAYELEQRRLAAEAEAAARAEQERLEKDAREAAAREQALLEAQAAEAVLVAAVEAEAQGDTETAQRLLDAPIFVPPVMAQPVFVPRPVVQAPTAQGVSFRDNWVGNVNNLMALAAAVVNGRAPLSLIKADESALNAYARSTRGTVPVPGVTFTNARVTSVRA